MLENFGSLADNFVCPDLTSYALYTPDWIQLDIKGLNGLAFSVKVKDGYEDMAKKTFIRSCYSYPYFEPTSNQGSSGSKVAWTNDIELHEYYYDKNDLITENIVQRLFKKKVTIYDFILFDLSTFYWMNIGTTFIAYEPGNMQSLGIEGSKSFNYSYQQGRQIFNITWTVKSLNVVIGQVGGYTALLWMFLHFLFDDYERFKFTNSLIGQVYTCTPDGPDAENARTVKDSKQRLVETLTTKSTSWYTYHEYNIA